MSMFGKSQRYLSVLQKVSDLEMRLESVRTDVDRQNLASQVTEISGDVDLAARMQAIFDSVQAEPGAIERLPEWALSIPGFGGVGLNDRWIQLGPIKIPAAVLALLPLPQGNFEEGLRRRELAEQRRDLLLAAQRAATVETFKEEVRKIRERLQRERDLRRGGRRDSTAAINP